MPYKRRILVVPVVLAGIFMLMALPGTAAQQANLSVIGNATVTLYYYDIVNGTKGAIVPMADNPQQVNWDPALAAPGMYTFSHVPASQWYYLEADHNGNKWYAIFFMGENVGTKTANVHIPPLTPANVTGDITASSSPTATATPPVSTPIPTINEGPRPTPGMGVLIAILAIIIAITRIAPKRR